MIIFKPTTRSVEGKYEIYPTDKPSRKKTNDSEVTNVNETEKKNQEETKESHQTTGLFYYLIQTGIL